MTPNMCPARKPAPTRPHRPAHPRSAKPAPASTPSVTASPAKPSSAPPKTPPPSDPRRRHPRHYQPIGPLEEPHRPDRQRYLAPPARAAIEQGILTIDAAKRPTTKPAPPTPGSTNKRLSLFITYEGRIRRALDRDQAEIQALRGNPQAEGSRRAGQGRRPLQIGQNGNKPYHPHPVRFFRSRSSRRIQPPRRPRASHGPPPPTLKSTEAVRFSKRNRCQPVFWRPTPHQRPAKEPYPRSSLTICPNPPGANAQRVCPVPFFSAVSASFSAGFSR